MTEKYSRIDFKDGIIQGIVVKDLRKHLDERGWLCELFRHDELSADLRPSMAYASQTLPGIKRGPHAHHDQTDIFFFLGPGNFKLVLWDDRPDSGTYRTRQTVYGGHDSPRLVLVPPGVVHGYKSLGPGPGLVFNAPNRLYGGEGKKGPVDEIRHEDDSESPFSF
jgi:dTDP-4-dehydrorhamnose 3,5-epimerase